MGKISRAIDNRARILAKAEKFNRQQQALVKMSPAVYEAAELLNDENLVWSSDFEAIRRPLLRLILAEARSGLHLRDLENLCMRIASQNPLL